MQYFKFSNLKNPMKFCFFCEVQRLSLRVSRLVILEWLLTTITVTFSSACKIFAFKAPCPDVYRGRYRLDDNELHDADALSEAAHRYADAVSDIIANVSLPGRLLISPFSESLLS